MYKITLLVMFMLLAGITNISAQSEKDLQKAEKIMSQIHPSHFNGSRGNICPTSSFLKKFLKAAELGHPFAQIKVAEIYYYGGYNGYLKDRPKSYEFFKKAEDKERVLASFGLSKFYYWGSVVPKDTIKALDYIIYFLENCDTEKHKVYLMDLLTNEILYKHISGWGFGYRRRTGFTDNNIDALYAADLLQYKLGKKTTHEFTIPDWNCFERSYLKGYPKAQEKVKELYAKGDTGAINIIRKEEDDIKLMNNLYQNMENIVKSPNFTVAKDSTIYKIKDYIWRYDKCIWPTGMAEKINKMIPFYRVTEWTGIDFKNKFYGVGFLAALAGADDYSRDIKDVTAVIQICNEETQPDYQRYYQKCMPILRKNLEKLTKDKFKSEEAYNEFWASVFRNAGRGGSSYSSSSSSSSSEESSSGKDPDTLPIESYKIEEGWQSTGLTPLSDAFADKLMVVKFGGNITRSFITKRRIDSYGYTANSSGKRYKTVEQAIAAEWIYREYKLIRTIGLIDD